jgi:dipeptidyl aminopeptidase/acylaminoacyl peptidase
MRRTFWLGALLAVLVLAAYATSPATARPTVPAPLPALALPFQAATPTPTVSYDGLSIDELTGRSYGGGAIRVESVMEERFPEFTRDLITYPSDGLTIYGFMNVPVGEGPFPVIIVLHGYIPPARYQTLAYTTLYANVLAKEGYITIHPNLRNFPPSDEGPNQFRTGYAIDVLNLIALIRAQAGQPGPLERADPDRIGLWGHSMGGGVTLRVMTISRDVRAAVMYAAVSGDESLRYTSGRARTGPIPPEGVLYRVSPINYLDRIQAPMSIHHGLEDEVVPVAYSQDLCARLEALEQEVECFMYRDQPHTFVNGGDRLFMRRVSEFFAAHLRP